MVRWLTALGFVIVVCPATAPSNYEYFIPRECITKIELSKDTNCHRKPEERFFHCDSIALTYHSQRCETVVSNYNLQK